MRKLSKSLKYTLFVGFCFALALLVAMRGNTRDTFVYLEVFRDLSQIPWNPIEFQEQYFMEWGFGLLSGFVKLLALPPEVLFFIISALTFFAIAKASVAFGLNAWSAIPFYLPTFFLTQQLMQIRQGLAVALAFWAIALLIQSNRRWLAAGIVSLSAPLFHVASLVPIVVALAIKRFTPIQRSYKNWLLALITLALIIFLSRAILSFELLKLTDRISVYIYDAEHGATRSIFDLANLRAIFLTLLFIIFRPQQDHLWFRTYMFLLGMYIVHLGIRIGFIDFAILSGRLATTIGFAEIFLLAFMLQFCIKQNIFRLFLIGGYMISHLTVALLIQLPFLIGDYFTPL